MFEKFLSLFNQGPEFNSGLFLILALLIGFFSGFLFPGFFFAIRNKFHRGKNKNLVNKALLHLQKLGYTQIEKNVDGRAHIKWNNRMGMSRLFLDIVAIKDDQIHGFLLKSGQKALPENPETRRELLEIFVNFELDALYLLNLDTKVISKTEFVLNPRDFTPPDPEGIKNWHWALIGLAFGYIFAKAISF